MTEPTTDQAGRPLKLFFWAAHLVDGCFRYRVEMPAAELARRGHEVAVNMAMPDAIIDTADVVIGQRVHRSPPSVRWQLMAKRRDRYGSPRLVYEIDDDLLSIDPRQNIFAGPFRDPVIRENIMDNMRCADMVTVTTEPLAEMARRYNANVAVIPNCFDESIFDLSLPAYRGTRYVLTTLGWQGSPTHFEDWKVIQPVVAELAQADPALRVRFLGSVHPAGIPESQIDFLKWTNDLTTHYKRVTRFDVGLSPLNGTIFNEAKSGLRYEEYSALGVPSVCSDVPAYRPWVVHGETGFLARTPAEWRRYLLDLINDPGLRLKIGDAARAAARAWTIQANGHRWEAAYRSLL
ncbi:MAG TPA: glycosyltransferase [Kofleriaceae bacterium]